MNLPRGSFSLKGPDRDVVLSNPSAAYPDRIGEAEDCETPFERWLHLADQLLGGQHRA